jgi:hypothetical protein
VKSGINPTTDNARARVVIAAIQPLKDSNGLEYFGSVLGLDPQLLARLFSSRPRQIHRLFREWVSFSSRANKRDPHSLVTSK